MLLAGIHFGVLFATATGRRNNIFRSEIVRYYVVCLVVAAAALACYTYFRGVYPSPGEALRYAWFQTVSFSTTTSYVATDVAVWGPLATLILLGMGVQSACAGSTTGGLKVDRVYLAAKIIRQQIRQQQHPNAIIRIKLGGVVQESTALGFVMLFIVTFLLLAVFGAAVLALWGYDPTAAMSTSLLFLSNVGTGFGPGAMYGNFDAMAGGLKAFLTLLMLLGRLEIFGLVQLFLLKWWR